ncbi:MAG: polysulfide reductase NrfD [Chloroflexi bacterium]|nr:polysulfide reductase NrfD [Chloroflexota bacterium]MCL5108379.1 polysulfide reductase NrfD [Chloroflexota bacterium]
MLRKGLYALAGLLILVGLWGFFGRLTTGHEQVGYGSYVVWGLWVAQYVFFVGLAGGLFFFATLDYLFGLRLFVGLGRVALFAALVSLGTGLFFIWVDLGHPLRIWKVYFNPNFQSVMTQIVWGYTAFGALTLAALALSAGRGAARRGLNLLLVGGVVLALFLSGGVGALFGVVGSRPFWHVGLLPVQFPVFSVASGAAALLVIVSLFTDRHDALRSSRLWALALLTIGLQLAKLYFLWADFSQSVYGGTPQNIDAVNAVLYGQYWWSFWLLQLLAGSLIPIAILALPRMARNGTAAGLAGMLTLVGFAVARVNIILPALAVPEIEALARAYVEPRLQFSYFPSAMEWAVSAGIIGLAGLVFLVGLDRLPLLVTGKEGGPKTWKTAN